MAVMSRRFQFSLRALLVVLTLAGVGMGAYANRVRHQQEAVARIEHMGAFAYYGYEWDDSRDWFHAGVVHEPGPALIRNSLGIDWLDSVVAIRFDGCSVSDTDLHWLTQRLPELRYLELRLTAVGDQGVSSIDKLRKLRNLELAETRVSDIGLKIIGRVRSLRSLDLCGTCVTDNGLTSLYGLAELRCIYLESTAVTPTGVTKLMKALPQVEKRRY